MEVAPENTQSAHPVYRTMPMSSVCMLHPLCAAGVTCYIA